MDLRVRVAQGRALMASVELGLQAVVELELSPLEQTLGVSALWRTTEIATQDLLRIVQELSVLRFRTMVEVAALQEEVFERDDEESSEEEGDDPNIEDFDFDNNLV